MYKQTITLETLQILYVTEYRLLKIAMPSSLFASVLVMPLGTAAYISLLLFRFIELVVAPMFTECVNPFGRENFDLKSPYSLITVVLLCATGRFDREQIFFATEEKLG